MKLPYIKVTCHILIDNTFIAIFRLPQNSNTNWYQISLLFHIQVGNHYSFSTCGDCLLTCVSVQICSCLFVWQNLTELLNMLPIQFTNFFNGLGPQQAKLTQTCIENTARNKVIINYLGQMKVCHFTSSSTNSQTPTL